MTNVSLQGRDKERDMLHRKQACCTGDIPKGIEHIAPPGSRSTKYKVELCLKGN